MSCQLLWFLQELCGPKNVFHLYSTICTAPKVLFVIIYTVSAKLSALMAVPAHQKSTESKMCCWPIWNNTHQKRQICSGSQTFQNLKVEIVVEKSIENLLQEWDLTSYLLDNLQISAPNINS